VSTVQGAIFSLFTCAAILYLVYTELVFNLSTSVVDRVHVNATSPDGLEVEFDISFPHIACALLSVDAADPQGQPQSLHLDRTHHVWKHRLDQAGREIGLRSKLELGQTMRSEDTLKALVERETGLKANGPLINTFIEEEPDCGSCYGAGDDGECCNTCDDVKRAYRRRGWMIPNLDIIDICKKQLKGIDEKNEGCNIHGVIALSTGGGDFHIAPGHTLEQFGSEDKLTFVDIIVNAFDTFNVSHTLHKLHFGVDFPGNTYQLDGQERWVTGQDTYVMHQYYIQVVPTLYRYLNGTQVQTNQFSVTEHQRHVHPGSNRGLPGVYFFYEVSPLHVEFEEYRLGWIRFFTSVCAVVGGVFTVMSALDQCVYHQTHGKIKNKYSSLG